MNVERGGVYVNVIVTFFYVLCYRIEKAKDRAVQILKRLLKTWFKYISLAVFIFMSLLPIFVSHAFYFIFLYDIDVPRS